MSESRGRLIGFILLGILLAAQLVGLYFGISFPVVELSEPDFGPIEEQMGSLDEQISLISGQMAMIDEAIGDMSAQVDGLQAEVNPGALDFGVGGGARPTNIAWLVASAVTVKNDQETWGTVKTDTIAEYTSAAGVTIDGLTIKDGAIGEALSVTGDFTATEDVNVGDWLDITAQTAITVTNGAAFTATGTYQPIQAAANVTPTITMADSGDMLFVTNVSTWTITFADSGTAKLGAARALGQYDTLLLMCDGTNWLEVSFTNN